MFDRAKLNNYLKLILLYYIRPQLFIYVDQQLRQCAIIGPVFTFFFFFYTDDIAEIKQKEAFRCVPAIQTVK